jgi:hypothetical protein
LDTRGTGSIGGRTELRDTRGLMATAATPVLTHPPVANPVLAAAIAHDLSAGDLAGAYGLAPGVGAAPVPGVKVPNPPDGAPPLGTHATHARRGARSGADMSPGPPAAVGPTRPPHGPIGAQGGGLSLGVGGGAASPLALMIVLGPIAVPCLGLVTQLRVHIQPTEGYRLERPG